MPESRAVTDIAHGVPPIAVSTTSTRVNHTGSWKYIRPVYSDRVAPCNQGCPVGIDIEGYMNLLREGRADAARELLLAENPLPAVTGRVCYHPCETACNRSRFDEAVSIHAVERALGDQALEVAPTWSAPWRPESIGVVGSGPAGIACAYHLARLGYPVTVYESDPEPGGLLRYGIPEYRLPKKILAREIERIRALGVEFQCGARVGRDVPLSVLEKHAAIFVATGANRSRPLGIEGEDVCGVRPGLEFLREVSRGGQPPIGARVVVVGGGNTAMDCARTAKRLGADVLVLYRRGRAEMPAHAEEVEEALREGVRFEFLATPTAVLANERVPERATLDCVEYSFDEYDPEPAPAFASALRCVRMRLGDPDESGRRRPVPVEGSEFTVPADTILTALGEDPDLDFLPEDVRRHAGVIHVNPLGGTSRTTVFAGGDVIEEPHTVAYAIGAGKRAAIGIDRFLRLSADGVLEGGELAELRLGPGGNLSMLRWRDAVPVRRTDPVNEAVPYEELNPEHFVHVPRAPDRLLPDRERRVAFGETNRGLTFEEAAAEALRCFNCGVCNQCELCLIFCPDAAITRVNGGFEIAYDYCKGCGVCAAECPRGAITMTREGL